MSTAWRMLIILFIARTAMAYQFQLIAALSPLLSDAWGYSFANIGLLIGLYLAPGVALAIPGGGVGRRFGEKRVVAVGMGLMALGAITASVSADLALQAAARLLAGTGGVVLNVLMSKMVADWFDGRSLATAMGVFVNSWPVGIAAALATAPLIAATGGLQAAFWATTAVVVLGGVIFVFGYAPSVTNFAASPTGPTVRPRLSLVAFQAVLCAGGVWGLYNAALGMIFGFGPAMLSAEGWSAAEASGATSIALWLVAVSVPAGGWLADATGRRDGVLVFGLATFAFAMAWAAVAEASTAVFVVLGVLGGLAAGPIMSLPAPHLPAAVRATGMGIFFTLFYAAVVFGPMIAGAVAESVDDPRAPFWFGVVLLGACAPLLIALRSLGQKTV